MPIYFESFVSGRKFKYATENIMKYLINEPDLYEILIKNEKGLY